MRRSLQMMVIAAAGAVFMTAPSAYAGNQSSNTSSNNSSNNGFVRDRVVDTYCEDGYCQRSVSRRTYRDDDGWVYRDGKRYRKLSRKNDDYRRYDDRRDRGRYARDDDDDDDDDRYDRRRGSGRDDDDDDDD